VFSLKDLIKTMKWGKNYFIERVCFLWHSGTYTVLQIVITVFIVDIAHRTAFICKNSVT